MEQLIQSWVHYRLHKGRYVCLLFDMANESIDIIHHNGYNKRSIKMKIIVDSRRFYRENSSNAFDWFSLSNFSRETLPFRASFRDFDLDPPLTYKGLKDAFHTGLFHVFLVLFSPHLIGHFRYTITRKRHSYSLLLFITSASLYSNCSKNYRRFTITK